MLIMSYWWRIKIHQQLVDDGIMVVKGKRNTTTVRVTDDRQMSVAVLDKSKMFADTEVPEIG